MIGRTNPIAFFLLMVFSMFLFACGGGAPEEGTEDADSTEVADDVEMEEMEDDEFDIILPSPLQIARIFQRAGLEYTSGVTNSVDNASKYSTNLSQTLNFGVYSADLAYLVLNNQPQDALNQMKAVKQLSESIGLSAIFNDDQVIKSFEENIGVEDTMITVLVQVQERMNEILQDNEQEYMSAVIFAGAWVEGMYIGSKVAGEKNNHALSNRIVEQMTILGNLVAGLEYHPSKTEEMSSIITQLTEVKAMYEGFESIKKLDEMEDYEIEDLTITDEERAALTEKIGSIRASIVNG